MLAQSGSGFITTLVNNTVITFEYNDLMFSMCGTIRLKTHRPIGPRASMPLASEVTHSTTESDSKPGPLESTEPWAEAQKPYGISGLILFHRRFGFISMLERTPIDSYKLKIYEHSKLAELRVNSVNLKPCRLYRYDFKMMPVRAGLPLRAPRLTDY
ncbi:hypothetical protein EVAR_18076_1 [Eumeta japonica]|uniref:Uncharacterized protein n=1 Tax=Eumeta variegata TaxID=151549 RepID=A0A4C1VIS8_EUMVA|nr:hypothetical protein EVAR_18076_1 [Eumeta japonica]